MVDSTRDVVREEWFHFTGPLEGAGVPYLYLDKRKLVSFGWGNLGDPIGLVLGLPFVHRDGRRADRVEIVGAWQAVKNRPDVAESGHTQAAKLTTIRLTQESMRIVALRKYDENLAHLRKRLPEWDSYPACARMALASVAWACGAGFRFPKMMACIAARDFGRYEMQKNAKGEDEEVCVGGAAFEIHMNEWTPEGKFNAGLVPRNVANKVLMYNAARVHAFHLDPDFLDWENKLAPSAC